MTLALRLIVVLAVLLPLARAIGHDGYQDWRQPDQPGASCCSNHDCAPSRAYLQGDQWRAQNPRTGEWLMVPWRKVMRGPSPDGRTHWCGRGSTTFCFWPGDTKS